MRYRYIITLILLFVAAIFAYPEEGPSSRSSVDRIVAIVNNDVIIQSEVEELLAVLYMQMRSEYSEERAQQELNKLQGVALERLIEDKLILEEAKKQKIEVPHQVIEERLSEMKSRFDNELDFQDELVRQGITLADLKRKITEQLMMSEAVEFNVKRGITVSPVEITVYYQAYQDEFKEPESVKVDSIFCESQDKAKGAFSRLRKGQDFKDVERQMSIGSSLGKVHRGELLKEIEDAIFSLEENELSNIIKTKTGFYIFKLIKKIPGQHLPLSKVEAKIEEYLRSQKMDRRFKEWVEKLKEDAYIIIK